MKFIILSFGLFIFGNAHAQLTNGSIAPNFTLDDYYGNTHTLYNYLDSGMTVFVEIFAAHCPSCWSYHNTNRMKNMYTNYGPDSTKEVMVLALEHDPYNDSNAFTGNHQPWVTAGDWLTGTPYPIFNVEGADRQVFTDYDVKWYPLIYKVCPNRTIERVFTNQTEVTLYQKVQDCQKLNVAEDNVKTGVVLVDYNTKRLLLRNTQNITAVSIFNSAGQVVKTMLADFETPVPLGDLPHGIYMVHVQTKTGNRIEKIQL